MWTVGLLEDVDLVVGEVDVERCNGVAEVMRLGRPAVRLIRPAH
jgi:hypothetical protein